MKKVFFRIAAAALALLAAAGGWWYFLDGRGPAIRTDLVRMPAEFGPPPPGYPTENALMLAYATGTLDLLDREAPVPVPEGVIEELDIEYGHEGDISLKLDLYRPAASDGPLPAVLFIHGGGWTGGRRSDYKIYTARLPLRGYIAATMSYRLADKHAFPACVSDTKCAVRWLRANAARLNIDPNKIAVAGGSAGGYLSMMAGYSSDVADFEGSGGNPDVSSRPDAVVNLYGPTDLTTPYARTHRTVTNFLKTPYDADPDLYQRASPLFHLDSGDPPTFIIQGALDSLVTPDQADALAEKLKASGVEYWYDCYPGWPHTMDVARPVNDRVLETIDAFLQHVFGAETREIPS